MRPPDETGQPNPARDSGREPERDPSQRQPDWQATGHPRAPGDGTTEPLEPYVRLHAHIEALRADRRPRHPGPLSPEEVEVYQMAALFRAAAPGADEPDPAFAARLREQLARERNTATRAPSTARGGERRSGGFSRRGVLAGGLGAAAALVAGAVIGSEFTRQPSPPEGQTSLVTNGEWVAVAQVAAIPVGAVKWFATATIVGYVRNVGGQFLALSGVCTHMGCLLQWNGADRTFDCPCHGGRFTEDGQSAPSSPVRYSPLPTLQTKVEQDQVWVYAATSTTTQPQQTVPGGPYGAYGDDQ